MVQISNAQHAAIIRLLSYYASVPVKTNRGREASRQSSLLAKSLRKKSPAASGEKQTA